MSDSNFVSIALDRLSDWIGSFVPGCARLPTRHSVKVSLILGGLGLAAGWIAITPLVVLQQLADMSKYELLLELIPGAALGVILILPLLAWEQRSPLVVLVGVLLAGGAGYCHLKLVELFVTGAEGPSVENFAIAGVLTGVIYAAAGIAVNRRREWWMLAPLMAISGVLHAAIAVSMDAMPILPIQSELEMFFHMSLSANLFAGVYAALGITLGAALWDHTPTAKFEADESTDGA